MVERTDIIQSTSAQDSLEAELRSLFAKAKMPTSPGLAARILKLMEDPSSSTSDFADILHADPALAARLLKMANSAEFAQRNPVTSIERAVTLLGLRRVKMISLGFQLLSHMDQLGGAPFDMREFWQHSLLRACLSRAVAKNVVPEHEDEAFLIGLLQECGILLLVQVLGCAYGGLYRSANLSSTAFHLVERASFPYTHVDAISVLAAEWGLPALIAAPLRKHHDPARITPESSPADHLEAVAYFVGGLRFRPDLTIDTGERMLGQYARDVLKLDESAEERVRDQAAQEYRRLAILYGDHVPRDVDPLDLLSEANRQLSSVAEQTDQHVLDLQAECRKIHRESQRLASALRDYRERAASDPLTGLPNRGAVIEAARQTFQNHHERRIPIAIMFVDLDNFKNLNDRFGHAAGDNVLKAMAMVMRREIGPSGLVGRYGGEEFVAVLEDISVDEADQIGQRIVDRVRAQDPKMFNISQPTTCSIGITWADDLADATPACLIAEADRLMYRAKREGKDRCYLKRFTWADLHPTGQHDDTSGTSGSDAAPPGIDADFESSTEFDVLAEVARQLNGKAASAGSEKRKQKRRELISPCLIRYYTGVGDVMKASSALLRNLSTGGAGLVIRQSMVRGEPVEIELHDGGKHLFLAGLVAFCRHVEEGIHEVGIQFVTHSLSPILSSDASSALERLNWVAHAVDTKKRAIRSKPDSAEEATQGA